MKKLIILLFIIFLASCDKIALKSVDFEKTGYAKVIEKSFVPEINGSGIGMGLGMGVSGSSGGNFGSLSAVSVSSSEQFVIVFKSQWNGIFTIDDKNLYSKYEKGDSIKFDYKEVRTKIKYFKGDSIGYSFLRIRNIREIEGKQYHANY